MKKNKIAFFAMFLVSLFLFSLPAHAGDHYRYINGNVIKWRWDPIQICIKPDAYQLPGIKSAVEHAVKVWTSVPEVPRISFTDDHESMFCNIIVDYKNLPDPDSIYLATNTNTPINIGDITKARINFNKQFSNYFGSTTNGAAVYDVTAVMSHELGHALGLEEDEDPNSVMYQTINLGSRPKSSLSSNDLFYIKKLYKDMR